MIDNKFCILTQNFLSKYLTSTYLCIQVMSHFYSTNYFHLHQESHVPEPLDSKHESRGDPDGVYFSDSESHSTSRHGGHGEELPESLADAISLGAISMMTGISCYDELPDDEHSTDSDLDHTSNPRSDAIGIRSRTRLTTCASLKLLGHSYWGPSSTSTSSSSSPSSPPGPESGPKLDTDYPHGKRGRHRVAVQRTKSEPAVVARRSKRRTRRSAKRKPLPSGSHIQSTEAVGSTDVDNVAEKQVRNDSVYFC